MQDLAAADAASYSEVEAPGDTPELPIMLRTLLISYIVLYALLMLALFCFADEDESESWWETPLDWLMATVSLIGMVLLAADVQGVVLKRVWKGVAIVLVVLSVYLNLRDRSRTLPAVAPEDRAIVTFADLGTLVLVGPPLILNLIYAFS